MGREKGLILESPKKGRTKEMEQTSVQIPQEVAGLISVVSERWGYYFAKRVKSAELMKATSPERQKVTKLGKAISEKVGEWMANGTDTRAEITALQTQLGQARAELKEKSAPYYEVMKPLSGAISYLDKILIPSQLQTVTGQPIVPKFQVSADILKAITKPAK